MNPEENKISVWVCREEKLVSGLSKRTTCGDVVKVLLEHQSPALLCASPQSYCIVEKWRGFERILPNKTKILRLWNAWGHEQENVRFVLVKSAASLPNTGPRSAEARVVASNESQKGPAKTAVTISQERQRRIVRKAFRKLEKINKKKEEEEEEEEPMSRDTSCGERMETLVHLVISQDHTIRQQVQRIKELDGEIERYESNVHFDRVKRHGTNYVQDTYLVERGSDGDADRDTLQTVAEAVTRFEEYANRCDQVLKLQEEIAEREMLLECLTGEIQEELNHRWMRRRQGELSGKDGESATEEMADSEMKVDPIQVPEVSQTNTGSESENQLEEERIKTQLDTSLYIGLRLNTDLEAIKNDLDLSQELWEDKQKELKDLLEKIDSLNECGEEDDKDDDAGQMPCVEENIGWVEEARGLSKTCSTNDDDSDTGLSSMHSQDSDNPPVCESLV